MVGIAEGVFGIFCVASGLPAGWLADRMRRDRLLRIFGCLMLGAHLHPFTQNPRAAGTNIITIFCCGITCCEQVCRRQAHCLLVAVHASGPQICMLMS